MNPPTVALAFEALDVSASCPCCDARMVRRTIIAEHRDLRAPVSWRYVNDHDDHFVDVAIEASCPVAVRLVRGANGVDATVVGSASITEAERKAVLAIAQSIAELDASLVSYFMRAAIGDPSVPLAKSFPLPDPVFDLPEDGRRLQAFESKSFVVMRDQPLTFQEIGGILGGSDGTSDGLIERFVMSSARPRFFVRCLLPLPVQDAAPWNVGLWVEVERKRFFEIRARWGDSSYASLTFTGVLANRLDDLAVEIGTAVDVAVTDAETAPFIVKSANAELERRLVTPWPAEGFFRAAVDGAYL